MQVKLATFRSAGREKIGLVHERDTRLFDLASAADRDGKSHPAFGSMLALIDAGPAALDQARALFDGGGKDESLSVDVAAVEILAPIPEPRQMRDGMSFPLHILQAPRGQLMLGTTWPNWRGSTPSRSASCPRSIASNRSTTSPTASACAAPTPR
jgi:hypothetical protein